MAQGRTLSGWISGDLQERADKAVKNEFKGNDSAFLRHVVDLYTSNAFGKRSERALLELATLFNPIFAAPLEKALEARAQKGRPVNQQLVLARFLEAFLRALENPEFNPAEPFSIFNSEEQLKTLLTKSPSGLLLLRLLHEVTLGKPAPGQSDAAALLYGDLSAKIHGVTPMKEETTRAKRR